MDFQGPDRLVPSQPNQVIRTTRLDVAAFLLARGLKLIRVEGPNSAVTFIFQDSTENSSDLTLEFYRGATVVAKLYADAQKRIRDLLWEQRRR